MRLMRLKIAERIEIRYSSSDSGFMVVVEDDGTGICREHMDKIFNPFFTTKGPDRVDRLGAISGV